MSILTQARNQSTINHDKLANTIFGSQESKNKFLEIKASLERSGVKSNLELMEKDRAQVMEYIIKRSIKLRPYWVDWVKQDFPNEVFSMIQGHNMGSIGLSMTIKLIQVMGTQEQIDKWVHRINSYEIVINYAQTELATGSDVQNIGTTAVFDPESQTFVLHTPDIKSIKWWPGDLGVCSTHSVVMAQLYSNGQKHGVHPFVIQIRDMNTMQPLPGVEVGDIGPKMGYEFKDNGYLRLTNVRVAKDALLGRFIQVSSSGDVKLTGNPKVMYSSMMSIRLLLLATSYTNILKGVTIATRYSYLRTQFKDSEGKEIPIINYQMQKEKLYIPLSFAYIINSCYTVLRKNVIDNDHRIKVGDFSKLKELHVALSAFKSWSTDLAHIAIDTLIKACGGHGFHGFSGLPSLFTNQYAEMILEGENTILYLQVSRALLKAYRNVLSGKNKNIANTFIYLTRNEELDNFSAEPKSESFYSLENHLRWFEKGTLWLVKNIFSKIQGHLEEGFDPKKIWDEKIGSRLLEMGRFQALYSMLLYTQERIEDIEDSEVKQSYTDLALLFGVHFMQQMSRVFFGAGCFTSEHVLAIQVAKETLMERIHPNALVLSEGINFPEFVYGSAIADSNEKPYENLFNWAKEFGQLNQFKDGIHPEMVKTWLPYSKSLRKEGIDQLKPNL